MHTLTPATPFPAEPGRGSLAGHEVRCSCGFVARTSLSALFAELEGHAHLAWAAGDSSAVRRIARVRRDTFRAVR